MECYLGDQEQLDRLPSPDSWSRWGLSEPESSMSTNKFFTTHPNEEYQLNFNGEALYKEFEMEDPFEQSSTSLDQSWSPCKGPGYELSDLLATTNQMDDIFLYKHISVDALGACFGARSSLLKEDLTSMDNLRGSTGFFPEFENGLSPADNHLADLIIESDYNPSHLFGAESLIYSETHAFPSPVGWGKGEVATLHSPHSSRQRDKLPVKVPLAKSLSSELDTVNDDSSLQVSSVLEEFERVITQLSEEGRICYRDSLYRLANNSKQRPVNHIKNGNGVLENSRSLMVHDETLRLEDMKSMEAETNAFDRAVANLMFSKHGS